MRLKPICRPLKQKAKTRVEMAQAEDDIERALIREGKLDPAERAEYVVNVVYEQQHKANNPLLFS